MKKKTQKAEINQKDTYSTNNSQNSASGTTPVSQVNPQFERPSTSSQVQANFSANNENILLRTALMQIECRGERFTIRALIDPGSQ